MIYIKILILCFCFSAKATSNHESIVKITFGDFISSSSLDMLSQGIIYAKNNDYPAIILCIETQTGNYEIIIKIMDVIKASPIPIFIYYTSNNSSIHGPGSALSLSSELSFIQQSGYIGPILKPQSHLIDFMNVLNNFIPITNDYNNLEKKLKGYLYNNKDTLNWLLHAENAINSLEAQKNGIIKYIIKDFDEIGSYLKNYTSIKGENLQIYEFNNNSTLQSVISFASSPQFIIALLLIGIYLLVLEVYVVGYGVAGVFGIISLGYCFYIINTVFGNYTSLVTMFIGTLLIITELFVFSLGFLSFIGVLAILWGAAFLFEFNGYIHLTWKFFLSLSFLNLIILLFMVYIIIKLKKKKNIIGVESLIGQEIIVVNFDGKDGIAKLYGEIWKIRCDEHLAPGDKAKVNKSVGLTLYVKP